MRNKILITGFIVISIISFIILSYYLYKRIKIEKHKDELLKRAERIILNNDNKENDETIDKYIFDDSVIGILEIPKISLLVPVAEGTTESVLEYSVGHFKNSSNWNGNIALASHNRGNYVAHYFEDINTLEMGDEIIYKTKLGERRYQVILNKIVDSTDWSVILQTEDNRITLITCIKNEPNKRLCIQAIEKK